MNNKINYIGGNKFFRLNILIKGSDKGGKDSYIKIDGRCLVYDNGKCVVVDGENDDMIIIGCSDKRKVFLKNKNRWDVI